MKKGSYLCANLTVIVSIWCLRQRRWSLFFSSLMRGPPRGRAPTGRWGGAPVVVFLPLILLTHGLLSYTAFSCPLYPRSINTHYQYILFLTFFRSLSFLIRTDGGRVFFCLLGQCEVINLRRLHSFLWSSFYPLISVFSLILSVGVCHSDLL